MTRQHFNGLLYDDNGELRGYKNDNGDERGIATIVQDPSGNHIGTVGLDGIVRKSAGIGRHVGIRIFDGRINATHAVDATSGTTYEAVFTLAEVPDSIRPILANGGGATYTITAMSAAAVPESNINGTTGVNWTVGSITGADTVPVAAGTAQPGLLRGNLMLIDNPNAYKTVAVRVFVPNTAGTITIMGSGANGVGQDFTNWASRSGLIHAFRNQVGNQTATAGAFTSTTNTSYSPIIGVEYMSRGKVVTIMTSGDSLESGQGTYKGDGPIYQAARQRVRAGYAVEIAQLSWAASATINNRGTPAIAFAAGIIPDYLVAACASPNDTGTTFNTGHATTWKQTAAKLKADCSQYRVELMMRTLVPSNSSIDTPAGTKEYGATDAIRIAWNAEILSWRARGMTVFDWSSVITGPVNANGQVTMASGTTSDSIHPNDTGNALIVASILSDKTLP